MSDGKKLNGQTFDPRFSAVFPFTERVHDYSGSTTNRVTGLEGQAATDITPIDEAAAKVRVYDLSAIQAILDAEVITYQDTVDLTGDLPPVLKSVAVTYNTNTGTGASSHPASQQYAISVGRDLSVSTSPRSRAQASAGIQPDVQPEIEEVFAQRVNATVYLFYTTETLTQAALITRLNTLTGSTVAAWPIFRPIAHTFTLKGQHVSIMSEADTTHSLAVSNTSYHQTYHYGDGHSKEVGLTTKSVHLPPCLHRALVLTGTSNSVTVSVDVDASSASMTALYNSAPFTINGVTNNPLTLTGTANASVSPTALAATVPPEIPTSGLYIYDVSVGEGLYGRIPVRVTLVDFSYFA